MSWCIEDYLLLPGQKWNSMKLLLFRLPGVSNLSTRCLITLDSLYVWLSRQQSLVWLKLTGPVTLKMLSLKSLRLPASPKTITLAARVTRWVAISFCCTLTVTNPNSTNTSQPWLLTVGGRWDLTRWPPSWDIANWPQACSWLEMPFSFFIACHLHSNSWVEEDLTKEIRSDAKCPPRHPRHSSLSRGTGQGGTPAPARWRRYTHPQSWESWCHVAGAASERAIMNRSHYQSADMATRH